MTTTDEENNGLSNTTEEFYPFIPKSVVVFLFNVMLTITVF